MSHKNNNIEAGTPDTSADYHFAGYRVDIRQRRLLSPAGDVLNLSSRAFDTLLALLQQHGNVLSKATLMALVWPNVIVEENNLNQAISSLRKTLGDTKNESRFIITVPGRGYGFIAPVERVLQQPAAPAAAADMAATTDSTATSAAAELTIPAQLSPMAFLLAAAALVLLAAGLLLWQPQGASGGAAVAMASVASSPSDTSSAALGSIANSIAVLPFADLDQDHDHSLFALGLHDQLINQLSKIRSLKVIARNSVLPLIDQQLSTPDIARMLRVESVLSGTLLFAGDQARVNLHLLDPQSGVTLWSSTYEANTHDLSDMIAVQGDIALQVAAALEAEIRQSEREQIGSLPTASFRAYRYNLAASNAHYRQDFAQEWSLSRQAVELDPDYVDALFTFSSVNTVLVATPLPGMSSRDHFELGLESAERMIDLEPGNSAGYALKAVALGTVPDWNGVEAMNATLKRMNTPLADRKHIALLLLCLGQFEEAIAIYQANLVTEPLNLFGRGFLMAALELSGNPAGADAEYQLGEELIPAWWGDQINIFLALGRGAALEDIDELNVPQELKELLHHIDDREVLDAGVQGYVASPSKVSAASLYYAAFAARLGDQALAVQLLRSALDDVWTSLFWLWLPVFDEARKLDAFKQLLRESGVVEYWGQHGWPQVCQPQGEDFSCNWSARPAASLQH
jgi:TolB-like protein/DNA-binding winged helix-turn-helix (wHTH) protein